MYNKILVPVDGSALAESVIPHVQSISGGCSVSEVILIRVLEPVKIPHSVMVMSQLKEKDIAGIEAEHEKEADQYLRELVERTDFGTVDFKTEILKGDVAECVGKYAEENGVDLIVISTHGRSGISRWVMGSVADRVLRSSCVPVLMVRAPGCVPGL